MTIRPHTGTRLTGPIGNNAFAYEQRKRTDPDPKLRLPELKTISSIEEIELGTLPAFTELDHDENVITYTGLQHIYQISFCTDAFSCIPPSTDVKNGDVKNYVPTGTIIPIYIFDNHNYALYFWATYRINDAYTASLPVIHIDQHSDLGIPTEPLVRNGESCSHLQQIGEPYLHLQQTGEPYLHLQQTGEPCSPLQDIARYTTHVCNVGNFIRPALDAGIITDCFWIKNEYDLQNMDIGRSYSSLPSTKKNYILDIDLDFRAPEMGTDLTKSIPLVQSLMHSASLITVASSPYFLDQNYALEVLERLFEK